MIRQHRRITLAVAAAAVCGLGVAGAANGAVTVSYSGAPGGGLAVTAPAGEANSVSVQLECAGDACGFRVVESLAVLAVAGPGCTLASVQPATIVCDAGQGVRSARIDLGDEDDRLTLTCDLPLRVVADLGPGNDVFRGCRGNASTDDVAAGPGNDIIDGEDGPDRLDGGPGRDRLRGGQGADALIARDGEEDLLSCGTDPGSRGIDDVSVESALALAAHDRATVDPADGLPRDCERIESARPGERNGVMPRPIGVTRAAGNGQVLVRLICRRLVCSGRVRADLFVRRRGVADRPGPIASTFNVPGGVVLAAPITLPRADVRALRRDGERTRVMRVAAFEPGRGGWRITVIAVPVRG